MRGAVTSLNHYQREPEAGTSPPNTSLSPVTDVSEVKLCMTEESQGKMNSLSLYTRIES